MDDIDAAAFILQFMNMIGAKFALRWCFIALFGAMSLMHGPIMAYASHAAGGPQVSGTHHAGDRHHHGGHHGPMHDESGIAHDGALPASEPAPPPQSTHCNSLACFLAVEPTPIVARHAHAALFGKMTVASQSEPAAAIPTPDTPPPRLHG